MLDSLKKLRSGFYLPMRDLGEVATGQEWAQKLADEIQSEVDDKYILREKADLYRLDPEQLGISHTEIDRMVEILCEYKTFDAFINKYYLSRPLFEDGEPVQFGDTFIDERGVVHTVQTLSVFDTGVVMVGDRGWRARLKPGDCLKRPSESERDTQEKIDRDFKELVGDAEANVVTSGVFGSYEVKDLIEDFRDILKRQQNLGKENHES